MSMRVTCNSSNCGSTTWPRISNTHTWAFFSLLLLAHVAALFTTPVSAQTFADVPTDYWAYSYIETLHDRGITGGCGGGNYCPENPVTRAQMAVFLERGINGSSYQPPTATGNVFLDVGADDFAADFIEQLYAEGITGGCGGNNYCPEQQITRAQMAVFLLRSIYGAGYIPPAATGLFADVDLSHWAAAWIEQLSAEGITAGCNSENYCPEDNVSRAQMAVFLVRAFDLDASGVIVTPAGGTIVATANDGTVFTLTVPPNALLADEEITITPASGAAGLPNDWTSIAGLRLEPDGLQLHVPASLQVSLVSTPAGDVQIYGFTIGDNAEIVEMKAAEINGNLATIELSHFSTAGVVELTDEQVVAFAETAWNDYQAELLAVGDCTGPSIGTTVSRLVNLGFLAEAVGDRIQLAPGTCNPYSCTDIVDMGTGAARQALQDKIRAVFVDADSQCNVTGVPQEAAALSCIAFAQTHDTLFIDGTFDETLMGLKSCGISVFDVTPDRQFLDAGETKLMQAIGKDKAGNVLEGRPVAWTSLDESIVTVEGNDRDGFVTGLQDGNAWVRAVDQISADAGVSIPGVSVDEAFITVGWSVEIVPDKKRLRPTERVQLKAILRDSDGTDITSNPFAWSSSDSDVATVDDSSGFEVWVTAVGNGTAKVRATDEQSGTYGEAKIIVGDAGNIVASGWHHNCVIGDGTVWCWGRNSHGQIGIGSYEDAHAAEAVPGITTAIAVASEWLHTCAVLEEGTVFCWGDNEYGQLGDGSTAGSNSPVQVVGIDSAISVAAGETHSCAVLAGGSVTCWGRNKVGALGNGSTSDSTTPVDVTGISTATKVAVASSHSCALLDSGIVKCWGSNNHGQLGDGTTNHSNTPVTVAGISSAVDVTTKGLRTCIVLEAGTVWCSKGIGITYNSDITHRWLDAGISGVVSYTIGKHHDCASLVDGSVWCAGWNQIGQLGIGTIDGPEFHEDCKIFVPYPCSTSPVKVDGLNNALVVRAGADHSCALLEDGTGWCWGSNTVGELGVGTNDGPELCPLIHDWARRVYSCSTVPVQVQ